MRVSSDPRAGQLIMFSGFNPFIIRPRTKCHRQLDRRGSEDAVTTDEVAKILFAKLSAAAARSKRIASVKEFDLNLFNSPILVGPD